MKTPLLLLHGALGSEAQFDALKKQFDIDYELHTFNFEGHGGRPSNTPFSIDLFVDNTLQYLQSKELKRLSIFGYSMGGYVALQLARNYPAYVDRIITLGTKLDWTPAIAAQEIQKLQPDIIEQKVPRFAAHLKALHAPLDWKVVVQQTAQMMQALGNGQAITPDDFAAIERPVCICLGTEDQMVTIGESQRVVELIPQGSFQAIADCPHPIEQVDIGVLHQLIIGYLES